MRFCERVCIIISMLSLSACGNLSKLSHGPANSVTEKPYVDRGKCYTPQTRYDYCQTGIASWYGDPFHGRPTATGVIFNKHLITAAHRTLPLPCVVEVINLDNNKKIKVLVNDRGPFAHIDRRIIDLSEQTARLLGFHRQGMARVKVTCLPCESMLAALYYGKRPYIGTCRTLTQKEFKYIKEGIIRDKSLHCESLKKHRRINEKHIRNRWNKGSCKRGNVKYRIAYANRSRGN